jgi:hypothetical protein
MKEQNGKGSAGDRPSQRIRDRVVAAQTRINPAPAVANPSTDSWKRYCACRLQHFASGR